MLFFGIKTTRFYGTRIFTISRAFYKSAFTSLNSPLVSGSKIKLVDSQGGGLLCFELDKLKWVIPWFMHQQFLETTSRLQDISLSAIGYTNLF